MNFLVTYYIFFFYFNRENLRLKEEIEKLQKQLIIEQSKQMTKSPVVHSISGKINQLKEFIFFL